MNGWSVLLLVADLAGVVIAVALTLGRPLREVDDRPLRNIRLAEIGLDGTLVALVAWQAEALGLGGVIALISVTLVAGEALRFTLVLTDLGDRMGAAPANQLGVLTAILVLTVLGVVGVAALLQAPRPADSQSADSARFGLHVFDHLPAAGQTLSRPPTVADAGVANGVAVSVERYAVSGDVLTLVVRHDLVCRDAAVVLGPDLDSPNVVDVIVVYTPPTPSPSSPPAASPLPNPCATNGVLTVHSALDVVLPASLHADRMRDVGGDGAATRVD
jgi:hypothetical protein